MIDNSEKLIAQALKLADQKEPVKALQAFREAAQVDPGNATAHRGVGMMLGALGRHPEAVQPLQTALSLAADDEIASRLLAGTFQILRQWEEAAGAWREVLRINPREDQAYLHLALALEGLGQFDEAAEAKRGYAKLHPQQPSAHAALAVALHRMGRYPEAVAELDEATRLDARFLAEHPYEQKVYAAARAGRSL